MDCSRPRPDPRALHVPVGGAGGDCLACFGFGGNGDDQVPLQIVAGADTECWYGAGPVTEGADRDIVYAADGQVCLGHYGSTEADPAVCAEQAYRQIAALQARLGYPHLLRVWHYLHDINRGRGDRERYKRFCEGRARALDDMVAAAAAPPLPAATMVGSEHPGLQMHFLLSRQAQTPLENPRQTPAYRYPRAYGRRRPAFARAARLDWPRGGQQLFISGTASIVGHATRHPGDVVAQLDEALTNIEAVLGRAGPRFAHQGITGLAQLRIYLRHTGDLPAVRGVLDRCIGQTPWQCLGAELCRRDLLVEAEAVAIVNAPGGQSSG